MPGDSRTQDDRLKRDGERVVGPPCWLAQSTAPDDGRCRRQRFPQAQSARKPVREEGLLMEFCMLMTLLLKNAR